jgi:hypothetical protein
MRPIGPDVVGFRKIYSGLFTMLLNYTKGGMRTLREGLANNAPGFL